MKCNKEDGCNGEIDEHQEVPLQTGLWTAAWAKPCAVCGRLHWADGSGLVANREGHRAFLEGSTVVNKDENGIEKYRSEELSLFPKCSLLIGARSSF